MPQNSQTALCATQVRSNHDLAKMVDTDEWILERTGISERRIASADETVRPWGIRLLYKPSTWLVLMPVNWIWLLSAQPVTKSPAAACEIKPCLALKPFRLWYCRRLLRLHLCFTIADHMSKCMAKKYWWLCWCVIVPLIQRITALWFYLVMVRAVRLRAKKQVF